MNDKYMELYTKLSRLQWLLQRHHMQNHSEHGPTADPTRGQGRVLAILKLQPELPTKDLSYLLGIRQQSLNELLNKLEKGGYVERVPSEEDRRVMVVRLTDKGKGEEQPKSDLTGIFDCLTDEEQSDFEKYLDRVIAALEAQLTADERDGIDSWMRAARERMGSRQFEKLMRMRGGPHAHSHRDDHGFHGGWWDDGRIHRGHGFHGPDGHGPAPDDIPGTERFDPDYDGPMPEGWDLGPHGGHHPDDPYDPPTPPRGPHDPKEK